MILSDLTVPSNHLKAFVNSPENEILSSFCKNYNVFKGKDREGDLRTTSFITYKTELVTKSQGCNDTQQEDFSPLHFLRFSRLINKVFSQFLLKMKNSVSSVMSSRKEAMVVTRSLLNLQH